ncbi:peptide deformylase [Ferrovibrio sp.]|uniref:peptide deformylase n=1 Tax=Ferrovibrio sp. TaxID=1917215 RepID=UPI0025C111C9|nr:peptide deformylase [Ferrovibrio sp.]MBX3453557.1 peptide deformylase [Ferrovibrio sp.]
MALLPIITVPDPRLLTASTPVEAVDDALRQTLDDMLETMYAAPGIGLAAIQVGIAKRMLVMDVAREGEERDPLFIINPEVIWVSDDDQSYEEGCLSLPEHYAEVVRPAEIKIKYLTRDGAPAELHATGLKAICLQHEMDHLDGILFVDHISALKRNMILRKLVKAKRLQEANV